MIDGQLTKKKNAVSKQVAPAEETSSQESYWRTMAEHYRTKLEEVTRENEQVTSRKFSSPSHSFALLAS